MTANLRDGAGIDTVAFVNATPGVTLDLAGDRLRTASGAAIGGTVKEAFEPSDEEGNIDGFFIGFRSGNLTFSPPPEDGARGTLAIEFGDGTSATVENRRNGDAGLEESGIDVAEGSFLFEKYLLPSPVPCASLAI